ncbi:hypothetical protein HanIR_Chr06g0264041 [Helianthus annuus]|nr:hypothetical protein HanIR_Chr06g0264041 [Helianthus annuus]
MHPPIKVNSHIYAPSIQPPASRHVSLKPEPALCRVAWQPSRFPPSQAASPPAHKYKPCRLIYKPSRVKYKPSRDSCIF